MGGVSKGEWTLSSARIFLENGNWLGSLPAPMRNRIIDSGEIVCVGGHSALYKIGDPVNGLYATLEGDVRAYAYGDENERIFLRALGPGSWFGDVHLLDNYPKRTFEAWAESSATLLFLPAASYRKLTEDDPACYRAFVKLMCIHMRHTVRVLVEARSEAPRRAARALIRLAVAHGIPTADGLRLAMNLSQGDLASLVGVSRQYMNELIAGWEQNGFVRWNGKSQPVLNVERLSTLLSPLDRWIEDSEDWV